MTEDSNQSLYPEPGNQLSGEAEQSVSLKLPAHLARLIQARSQQLGKSPTEVILAVLQSALGQPEASSDPGPAAPHADILDTVQTRLAALEALIPRLVQLEGKWMAF